MSLEARVRRLERLIDTLASRDVPVDVRAAAELTINAGAITIETLPFPTVRYRTIDTEGNAATDDLHTISGGVTGDVLILAQKENTRDVTFKDAIGNLLLAGDFSPDATPDTIMLVKSGSVWLETSRSNN